MPYKNKADQSAYFKRWYSHNKEKRIQQVKERKNEIRQWFAEYKATLSCEICSESDPVCLDFHHNTGVKNFTIGEAASDGYGRDTLLKEIDLCIVLCANCHRKEHR